VGGAYYVREEAIEPGLVTNGEINCEDYCVFACVMAQLIGALLTRVRRCHRDRCLVPATASQAAAEALVAGARSITFSFEFTRCALALLGHLEVLELIERRWGAGVCAEWHPKR